jgi:hypothetical protein
MPDFPFSQLRQRIRQAVIRTICVPQLNSQQLVEGFSPRIDPVTHHDHPMILLRQHITQPDYDQGADTDALPRPMWLDLSINDLGVATLRSSSSSQRTDSQQFRM